jgi:NADH-quinone oxidoreductase subunit J
MEALFFYIFGGLAFVSGVLVVFLRKPVHNAVALIFTLFCVAGLYLLLQAEFIAVIQVLVYAGAIMVLFLFVIMLLNLEGEEAGNGGRTRFRQWLGVFVAVAIFLLLVPVWAVQVLPGLKGGFTPERVHQLGNTVWVARMLFTKYLLPFEIASVLLLAAMVGAVFFAMRRF